MESGSKKVPFVEGMWTTKPDGGVNLLGSRCPACGELFFPRREKGLCVHCQNLVLEEVELGREGKIAAFTAVLQPPAGGAYFGPVPYNYGLVDLDEGIRVETQIGGSHEKLKVGLRVKLSVEDFYTDKEGNIVQRFIFQPVEG